MGAYVRLFCAVILFPFRICQVWEAFEKSDVLVVLLSSVYGLTLEFAQFQFFTYRYFEWADAVANVLGAVLGFLIFLTVKGKIGV